MTSSTALIIVCIDQTQDSMFVICRLLFQCLKHYCQNTQLKIFEYYTSVFIRKIFEQCAINIFFENCLRSDFQKKSTFYNTACIQVGRFESSVKRDFPRVRYCRSWRQEDDLAYFLFLRLQARENKMDFLMVTRTTTLGFQ